MSEKFFENRLEAEQFKREIRKSGGRADVIPPTPKRNNFEVYYEAQA